MFLRGNALDTVRIEQWNDIRELALMSIGTDKGTWWADPNFGSELWLLRKNGKVDGQTAGTLRRMVLESLQWIIMGSLAKKIECTAERTGKNEVRYSVTIFRSNENKVLITEVWRAV
jgi:phage gp46-like protein